MVASNDLRRALDAAYEYYSSTFFNHKTKVTEQQAKAAMTVLNTFKKNGQQLYDKAYWGLGPSDSICATVGHLRGQWNMIECFITNINQREKFSQQHSAE